MRRFCESETCFSEYIVNMDLTFTSKLLNFPFSISPGGDRNSAKRGKDCTPCSRSFDRCSCRSSGASFRLAYFHRPTQTRSHETDIYKHPRADRARQVHCGLDGLLVLSFAPRFEQARRTNHCRA